MEAATDEKIADKKKYCLEWCNTNFNNNTA